MQSTVHVHKRCKMHIPTPEGFFRVYGILKKAGHADDRELSSEPFSVATKGTFWRLTESAKPGFSLPMRNNFQIRPAQMRASYPFLCKYDEYMSRVEDG